MIIDFHGHLGDILSPNGGELIFQTGIEPVSEDLISNAEQNLYRMPQDRQATTDAATASTMMDLVTEAARARNFTATLENWQRSMDDADIQMAVCLPIPPYLTFEDLKRARELDERIIPFSGVDFTRQYNIESSLRQDVTQGAKGIKLHPIIQNLPLDDIRIHEAIEAFAPHDLPILLHCGTMSYYLGEEKVSRQTPAYGEVRYTQKLVSDFPTVSFVVGHAGLIEVQEVMERLGEYENVWVDISFQSPENVIELISVFGPERVLFGSDWPFGNRPPVKTIVQEVCRGDRSLENLIFRENAVRLLRIQS
jgi:predicted TIM-barrel fold metal-dependent hydrolase